MDVILQSGASLQVGVDQDTRVVAADVEAEVGLLCRQGLLQVFQPALIQVGQGALPLPGLEQPGQLMELNLPVHEIIVVVIAVVVAAAQPEGVPLADGEHRSPEAPRPDDQGQQHRGRLGRQACFQFFHGITSWRGNVEAGRGAPVCALLPPYGEAHRPAPTLFPSCNPIPTPP